MSHCSARRSSLRSTLCRTAALASASAILLPVASAAASTAQPTGLRVQATSATRVALSWNLQPDADHYDVFRNGSLFATMTTKRSTAVATPTQSAGTTAKYSVRAIGTDGSWSAMSATVTATTATTSSLSSLSACQPGVVLPAGNYRLTANITMTDPSKPCFQFRGGSSLYGNGKTITVTDGRGAPLSDGTLYGTHEPVIRLVSGSKVFLHDLDITTKDKLAVQIGSSTTDGTRSATDVVISDSKFRNKAADPSLAAGQDFGAPAVNITNAQYATVTTNQFLNTTVGMTDVVDSNFASNVGRLGSNYKYYAGAAGITLRHVDRVNVGNNDLNGGGTGGFDGTGSDDNILIYGISSDLVVSDNTVGHAFDAGIEFVGMIARGRFERNTIDSVGFAAIGEYYRLYVMDSVFRGNKATNSPSLIHFRTGDRFDEAGWKDIAPGRDYGFMSNIIEGNQLTAPTTWGGSIQPPICVNTAQFTSTSAYWLPEQAQILAWNNVLRNNTAPATGPALRAYPAGMMDQAASTGNTPSLTYAKATC